MKPPKPTRRDFSAALVGAVAMALTFALLGLGPWRYTVATCASSQNSSVAAYVVDTWTGRPRLWIYGDEQETETVTEQLAARIAEVRRRAPEKVDEDGRRYYLCELGGYPSEVVRVYPEDLRKFLKSEPLARPATK